jgi:hypothetical protein
MAWKPSDEIDPESKKPYDQATLGKKLVEDYGIRSPAVLTSCSTCHR